MKITIAILIMALFSSLCGCIPRPTLDQIKNADYGIYPKNYKIIVTDFVKQTTLDPEKVILSNWQGPFKSLYYISNGVAYGYSLCVQINPMNEMGGHVGKRLYSFTMRNDVIIRYDGGYKKGLYLDQRLEDECGHLANINYNKTFSATIDSSLGVEDGPRPF